MLADRRPENAGYHRRMARGAVGAGLLAACICAGATAEAGPQRTSSLSWTRLAGAEACIAPRELAREVERRLGRAVFVSAAQADVTVEGHVEADAPGFRAVIRLLDADGTALGTRELESADATCAELAPTLSLAMALMIDPDSGNAYTPPPPMPVTPAPPMPLRVTPAGHDASARGAAPPSAPDASRMRVDAGPVLSAGLLPGVTAPGVALRWLFDVDGVPGFEFSGAYFPPTDVEAMPDLELAYGGVALCPLSFGTTTRLEPCGGVHVGWLHASTGYEDVAVIPFLGARGSHRVFGPLVASLGLGVFVPMNRQRIVLRGSGTFELSPVAGVADLGIGFEVP